MPDPMQPDPMQPDPMQPDAAQIDAAQHHAAEADAAQTDAAQIDPDSTHGVRRRRAVRRVRSATRQLVDTAEELAAALGSAATESAGEALTERIVPTAAGIARRVSRGRPGFRRRRTELEPLRNLYRVHPEARLAPVRELGLITIPVEEVVGTAVEGPDQRGRDFKPLPAFRSNNWEARWQRLQHATDRLVSLPPIDVLKTAEGYWVTDGHNRVAMAIENGQLDIDADVRAVILPGEASVRPAGPLAPVLVDSAGLQSTRRATRPRAPKEATPATPLSGDAAPASIDAAPASTDETDPETP